MIKKITAPFEHCAAIIGMGCIFPKSSTLKDYWHLLFNGIDAIEDIPEKTHWKLNDYFDQDPSTPDHTYCRRGGFLPPVTFDPLSYGIPPNNIEATDTSQLLGLEVAKMALEDAGYPMNHPFLEQKKVNVILGVTGTQELVIPLGARLGHPIWKKALKDAGIHEEKRKEIIQSIQEAYVPWQENSFPGLLGNVVAGRIANRLNLSGTNTVTDAACASSLSALHTAVMELASGKCDMSITGGVDTLNDIFMHMCFSKTGVLSHTSDAKPFSKDADGTVLGEGIGMLVLKRLKDAQQDKDRIYAVIKGIGTSSDGRTSAIYAPETKGQVKALNEAYAEAGIDPSTIGLLEAHGTGTRVGDKVEFNALKQCFEPSDQKNKIAIGSVKSMIGHTKAAAGAAGLIKAALALYNKVLPPTLKAAEPDPELDINNSSFYLNSESKPWVSPSCSTPRRSGVSAFGFGGSNFHVVLEEYTPSKSHVSWDGAVQIIAFSCDTKKRLLEKIYSFKTMISQVEDVQEKTQILSWMASESRQGFSVDHDFRLLMIHKKEADIQQNISNALETMNTGKQHPDIYFSFGENPGKKKQSLGFLFPGQGSQYTGMGKDLISVFPEALEALEHAADTFSRENNASGDKPLYQYIFPPPLHLQPKNASEETLRKTNIAQPAIGALSLAMIKILKRFGIAPQIACGHSFGELSALCSAGWMDEDDFLSLATLRGKHMAAAASSVDGDSGSMLAVQAPLADIDRLIKEASLDLVLANKNSPTQGVLSGSTRQILCAKKRCRQKKITAIKLPVAAAFHSNLVKTAVKPFMAELSATKFFPTQIDVLSNTTGKPYVKKDAEIKKTLGQQLIHPVEFVENIKTMAARGVSTFIEVGPKAVLTGLTKSILKNTPITAISLDPSSGEKSGIEDLAHVLCTIAAKGFSIDLTPWEDAAKRPKPKKMKLQLSGANPKPKKRDRSSKSKLKLPQKKIIKKNRSILKGSNMTFQKNQKKDAGNLNLPGYEAMKMVQQGLEAMQQLQAQTARAHEKFLETQAQASITLAGMLEHTQNLAVMTPPFNNAAVKAVETEIKIAPPQETQPHLPEEAENTTADTQIKDTLFKIISQLTGFPVEMLESSMNLESDLGIDSIKRVEILSTLEQELDYIETISSDDIANLKTIEEIVTYLGQYNPETLVVEPEPKKKTSMPHNTPQKHVETVTSETKLTRQVVFLQEYPTHQIRFYNGAKIELPAKKKVYITRDHSRIADAFKTEFEKLGIDACLIDISNNDIPELPDAAGLVLVPDAFTKNTLTDTAHAFLKSAFLLVKKNAGYLMTSGKEKGAFLVTVSFLGGGFGFSEKAFHGDPVYGGLAGLAKTADLEWKHVLCRALDLPDSKKDCMKNAEAAVSLMMTHGSVEMGLDGDSCNIPTLIDQDLKYRSVNLTSDDVVVVTGGARGVTAACAIEITREYSPTIILIGRSAIPSLEPEWAKNIQDPGRLKKIILTHEFKDLTPKPADIEKIYKKIISNREIQKNIQAMKKNGSQVRYFSADIRNSKQVDQIFNTVRKEFTSITAVIHGAGVLEDKLIIDKHIDQFNRVLETKTKGLASLLAASEKDPLKYFVLFSSIAARTGNKGQCDYSIANEILNKTAQKRARKNPDCKFLSLNWGPWEGGMVDDALKKEFQKKDIPLIPLKAGARHLLKEMGNTKKTSPEVVLGGPFLPLKKSKQPNLSKAMTLSFGLAATPVLAAHKIAGNPVVPFALIMECLAHAAEKNNPGLVFAGIDNLRLLKGITAGKKEVTLHVNLGKCTPDENGFKTPGNMTSHNLDTPSFIHSTCTLILKNSLPDPPVLSKTAFTALTSYSLTPDQAYSKVLFHGKALQSIKSITGCSKNGIEIITGLAPKPDKWFKTPFSSKWTMDPMMLDAAFQAAILWSYERRGQVCLPSFIANLRVYASYKKTNSDIKIIFIVNKETKNKIKGYFTFLNTEDTVVASITGFEAVTDPSLNEKFKNKPLFSKESILAFAQGNPSEAFGKNYKIFDKDRKIARLPRPPYFFMDRVVAADHPQWEMKPGGWIETQYDIPKNAWYFNANRTDALPYCILLEIALQPCGWLAAYAGSALESKDRLYFRNLGGKATLIKQLSRNSGTLTIRNRMTDVSKAGGMIIQDFEILVLKDGEAVYTAKTNFGFFSRQALSNQLGIRDSKFNTYPLPAVAVRPSTGYQIKDHAPLTPEDKNTSKNNGMPSKALKMIDHIETLNFDAGIYKKGYIKAIKRVDPLEWFFSAHFYQDPVCPGSLGIESFLQLLRFFLLEKYDIPQETYTARMIQHQTHEWRYRGQIVPSNKSIEIHAHIKDEVHKNDTYSVMADGALVVDGICIYEMMDFGLGFYKIQQPVQSSNSAARSILE